MTFSAFNNLGISIYKKVRGFADTLQNILPSSSNVVRSGVCFVQDCSSLLSEEEEV